MRNFKCDLSDVTVSIVDTQDKPRYIVKDGNSVISDGNNDQHFSFMANVFTVMINKGYAPFTVQKGTAKFARTPTC